MKDRNGAIDTFRAVAVLMVMAYHYTVRWAPPEWPANLYGYPFTFPGFLTLGKYGVHLFFVISGLVITMTVLRSSSPLDFALRRFARLWPPLAACGAITLLIGSFGPIEFHRQLTDYLASLTFFPEVFGARPVDGAYWSLAVEIKFYAAAALASALLGRRFWIGLLALGWIGLAGVLSGHGATLLLQPYAPYFLLGMAGWYGLFEHQPRPAMALASSSLIFLAAQSPDAGMMLVLLLATAMAIAIYRGVGVPILSGIGRASYSAYLVHQFAGVTLIAALTALGVPGPLAIWAVLLAVLAASLLLHRFVELPGQRAVLILVSKLNPISRPSGAAVPPA